MNSKHRTTKPSPSDLLWKDKDAVLAFDQLLAWVTALAEGIKRVKIGFTGQLVEDDWWKDTIRLQTLLGEVSGVQSMLQQLANQDHQLPYGTRSGLSIATARHLCATVPHKLYWSAVVYGLTPRGRIFPVPAHDADGFLTRLDAVVAGVGTESWRPNLSEGTQNPCRQAKCVEANERVSL
jgi:hypothetical protein